MPEKLDYKAAREKYRPSKIETLWIAESPPASGGYFYFEKATGKNPVNLFSETMKALGWWTPDSRMHAGFDKSHYLRRFQENGHFLIDATDIPVNHLKAAARNAALRENMTILQAEVETLQPKKILLIKKNVHDILYPVLKSDYNVLNGNYIPFPASSQQPKFRRLVRKYLKVTD